MNATLIEEASANEMEKFIRDSMRQSCDAAAPRTGSPPTKKQTYWWTDDVTELRRNAIVKRRAWLRDRRRRSSTEEERENLENAYRTTKRALRKAIGQAKTKAWRELIATIEEDPWGLPYKVVLKKLRRASDNLTETLEEEKLNHLLSFLFPMGNHFWSGSRENGEQEQNGEEEETKVTALEIQKIVRRPGARYAAPGLDGITKGILKDIPKEMFEVLAKGFTRCFKQRIFSEEWKKTLLVLILKQGGTGNPMDLPKARPICLLSELGKTLERLIADRIKTWNGREP